MRQLLVPILVYAGLGLAFAFFLARRETDLASRATTARAMRATQRSHDQLRGRAEDSPRPLIPLQNRPPLSFLHCEEAFAPAPLIV